MDETTKMTDRKPAQASCQPLNVAHWGTYRVETKDGRAVALHGFEDDPDPSPIGQAMLDTLTDPCRITAPMVRRSFLEHRDEDHRALRGRDSFVEVDWNQALDLVAGELTRVRDEHGNKSIYAGSYGWASAGRFHHAQSQLRRFMNLFGGSTTSRNSYSYAAAEVILPHVVAPLKRLMAQHTSWKSISEGARLVVLFGGMAMRNAQVNPGGVGCHTQRQDMLAAKNAGVEFINISPTATDTLKDLQADWLGIIPNTDVPMMLALAHTLVAEGLHDQDFLNRYCVGFEKFKPYLMGTLDGQPKDAHWAQKITGIEAEQTIALARRMAQTPTMISASWSLTRQQNGEQTYWMLVVLAAMLGGIGKPGTGFALGLGAIGSVGSHRSNISLAALPTGNNRVNSFIPVARIADMLLHPGDPFQYDGQDLRYPDIKLVYWAGGNPYHHHQDLNKLRRAWQRIETVVVHEPFWTPLARHADIVLPTTVSLERNDLAGSPLDNYFFASQKVCEPYRGVRNDYDIFTGLASRLTPIDTRHIGFEKAFTQGRTPEQWIEVLYAETKRQNEMQGRTLPTFDEFMQSGVVKVEAPQTPCIMLQDFRADPDAYPLATPSGRLEIFSETIAGFGLNDQPGHPLWHEPDEWLGASRAHKYPLHLISHQPARRLHSQLDHSAHSRSGKINRREPCVLHPDDAALRDLKEGDMVRIYNDRGSCISVVQLDNNVTRRVLMMATGAWYDPDWSGDPQCCKHGNPNTLTGDIPTSLLAQGPSALSCLVEIELYRGKAPDVTAFEPPVIQSAIRA